MILQMEFDFGKEKYLAMFLGELLGKTMALYKALGGGVEDVIFRLDYQKGIEG